MAGSISPLDSIEKLIAQANEQHATTKKKELARFFNSVETHSLTGKQINACICMDDAVMIIAAAGSGKTSTMVAKVGYVLLEAIAAPDQILVLGKL